MLVKLSTFKGTLTGGEPLVKVFPQGGSIHKYAAQMQPEIQDWLSTYKSDKENIAVLVNALGASEYWGQNSNGDRFSWGALTHDCSKHAGVQHPFDPFSRKIIPEYGYKTFLNAHPFAHHRNKDPSRAFGNVVVSTLNLPMKRVELVVLVNRAKAEQFGGAHVISRLDAGEFPDVSMGCRVPYDVCTICGNKSKTRNDYCSCIKTMGMGFVLPDGRMVGVWNPHPRFFDISFVFIGADKTAKVMMKLGSGLIVPSSVIDGEILYGIDDNDEDLKKVASYCGTKCGVCQNHGSCDKFNTVVAMKKEARSLTLAPPSGKTDVVGKLASAETKVGPPPNPNRAEYPFVATIDYKGIKIHVENLRGSVREGTDASGKKWRTNMRHHYGEIVGTKGVDRDKLDVYVGPHSDVDEVYVIHQNHPGDHPSKAGKYDEDKVMLGFSTPKEARNAYLAQYTRPDFYRSMTIMPLEQFKKSVYTELKGEKVAGLDKVAADLQLEDLFMGGKDYERRKRTWRNKVTGEESHHVGSGLGEHMDDFKKTASTSLENRWERLLERKPYLREKYQGKSASVATLKTAALKMADRLKRAEIDKEVPPDKADGLVTQVLSDKEPDIPQETLKSMSSGSLEEALSTPSAMGMVMRPREFQRLLLGKIGREDLANDLDQRGVIFGPSDREEAPCAGLGRHHIRPDLLSALLGLVRDRSYYGPALHRRIIRITVIPKPKPEVEENSPLLSKIGAAYNWYRREMVKLATEADQILAEYPELMSEVYGVEEGDLFKQASSGSVIVPALGSVPLTLMYSAHLRDRGMRGGQLNPVQRMVANHPLLSSLGVAAGVRGVLSSPSVKGAIRGVGRKMSEI